MVEKSVQALPLPSISPTVAVSQRNGQSIRPSIEPSQGVPPRRPWWILPDPVLRGASSPSGSLAARPQPLVRCAPGGAAVPRETRAGHPGRDAAGGVCRWGGGQVARSLGVGAQKGCWNSYPLQERIFLTRRQSISSARSSSVLTVSGRVACWYGAFS
jgi:hypothetical protein